MDVLGDRYELREQLGTGGMAIVWRAWDLRLHRTVAVKVLSRVLASDPSFLARFEREARHAAALNHPNIVTIFDYGVQDDAAYLVMELVDGESLAKRVRRVQHLDLADTVRIAAGVLSGLSEAHQQGIIHRDIKPSNILLGPEGVVKVADFGIARASGDSTQLTDTGVLIGTVGYLSPEQCAGGSATERSDLYSVGCLAFECLIGRPPFTGETPASVMYQHEHAQPERVSTLRPDVPAAIDAIVARSLEKDPARRYGSAIEMRGALRDELPQPAPATQVSEDATQPLANTAAFGPRVTSKTAIAKSRRPYAIAGLVIVLALALAVGLLAATRHGPPNLSASHHGTSTTVASPGASSSTTQPLATGSETVVLPVVSCPTTYGVSPNNPSVPSTMSISLPASLASSDLSYYAAEDDSLSALAPAGWSCSASVGADGSAELIAVPSAEASGIANQSASALSGQDYPQAITVSDTSACVACAYFQACGLFPQATAQYNADYGPCTSTPPKQENVTLLSQTVAAFEDPAGVHGTGSPSGGVNPANGIVTFSPGGSGESTSSYMSTCTLPDSEHALCTASLNDVIQRYWNS